MNNKRHHQIVEEQKQYIRIRHAFLIIRRNELNNTEYKKYRKLNRLRHLYIMHEEYKIYRRNKYGK